MENDCQILNQIKPISTAYLVPNGYFNNLSANILVKINSKKLTYEIPENYFVTTSFKILEKIKIQSKNNEIIEELNNTAPTLNNISKSGIYAIPENYFENFTIILSDKEGIVKKLNSRFRWVKYAAAAILTGVIAISIFYSNTINKTIDLYNKSINADIAKSVVSISDNDLSSAIIVEEIFFAGIEESNLLPMQTDVNFKEEVQFISDDIIETYITNNIANENDYKPTS